MFRIGVYVASNYDSEYLKPRLDDDLEIQHQITGGHESPYEVFHSDFRFYIGGTQILAENMLPCFSSFASQ